MLGMFKAMRTTIRHLPMKKITVQYPEERERLPERSRGLFRVVIDPAERRPALPRLHALREQLPGAGHPRQLHQQVRAAGAQRGAHRRGAPRAPSRASTSTPLQPVLDDYYEHGTGLIAMLQNTQEVYGYLPRLALQEISLRDRRLALADLRRGQLLQPVPPLAGRRVHHRRVPRHRLPRGGAPCRSPTPWRRSSASPTARPPRT